MKRTVWFARHFVNIDQLINMKAGRDTWLTAEQAMALLGVTRQTLYAYVSRGRIRSEPAPGRTRRRRYAADDVERLLARNRERRDPGQAAAQAMHWGLPVLDSAITLITDDNLYYRGRNAIELARSATIAEVAALLWSGTVSDGAQPSDPRPPAACGAADTPYIPHAQAVLARAAAEDPGAFDLRETGLFRTGWRIVELLSAAALRENVQADSIDRRLAAAWGAPDATELLRAALILSADHELNVSSFTARCVASAGASPYGAVIAGLAALEGFRHGGTTTRLEAIWDSLVGTNDSQRALARHLRGRGEMEGFGHPLYPGGDPRAKLLLAMLPDSMAATAVRHFVDCADELIGERPTLDFALVAAARALGLPPGAPLTLFAIGRSIGWIGQAIEQYGHNSLIRPRARYVGIVPNRDVANI